MKSIKKIENILDIFFKQLEEKLKAYNDLCSFKIYMNDVGVLRKMANLDSRIVIEGDKLFYL